MNTLRYIVQIMNNKLREDALTREILEVIDDQSNVTQRHLAQRLGVALGLANSYLKRCVRKGLIKIEEAPANRYLYYLTPRGFAEKSRLTAEYLSSSFDFYRRASASCSKLFKQCRARQYRRVLLCGKSELTEIASLRAREEGIEIDAILDSGSDVIEFIGIRVITDLDNAGDFDACVITSISSSSDTLEFLEQRVSKNKIFIPDILGINGGGNELD
jgi:DNA-binding MarR family transcriptional regulator